MINLTIGETLELQDCRRALERTLDRLDHLGAGLAAIHVNAAIEQLNGNLEAIVKLCQEQSPTPSHCDDFNWDHIGNGDIPRVTH
ncbi:hypothetical protein [Erythrobacter sp. Alg231-14]|uniref:hypothetical protein n=1 Tax=Erythrobacter sp. Alg231-14 TaxID=1922225 RepID=UPI000D56103B